ncbi:GntR family transcriptional regulator [Rhizobium rhizosphaerae]|uniref:GntR family transcriptional regulator n=1 Tax=Xaviernesmea rhizosphaerae TaxID=1672749 RepID=A0A1Q9AD90_9HYPH|nr:FCD domain-containing protein [Xaviernesmea rhizosphaerae]OLP52895.1 GntR family transcriptional regulator [Xaviernesmea rhizosphaerae]
MTRLAERIETIMSENGLAPGDRLPSERQLAFTLGVSRSSLREALQMLISRGRLVSRQGGGTYVAAKADPQALPAIAAALSPLTERAAGEPGYWLDVMELRRSLEGDAAAHAALRATPADRLRLQAALDQVTDAGPQDPEAQARADADFHMAVAEASHNIVLRQVMAGLFDLLQASISESLRALYRQPETTEPLARQHRAIAEAILAGDAERARAAALTHLDHVALSLRPLAEADARHRRAAAVLADHAGADHARADHRSL